MKYLAIVLMLLLVSCGETITGGSITGKYTKIEGGLVTDTTHYFLQVTKHGQSGVVEVTEAAWNQANKGLTWPFKVK